MTKTYALDTLEAEILKLLHHLQIGASITLTKKLTESGDITVECSIPDGYFAKQYQQGQREKSLETFLHWRKQAKADGTFLGWAEDDNPWQNIRDKSSEMRENPWS